MASEKDKHYNVGRDHPNWGKRRENSSNWKGGYLIHDGYKYIYQPEHPCATKSGYVAEDRLVAEKALGRYLKPNERVHHINKNKMDNRNRNLLICYSWYNLILHKIMRGHKIWRQNRV